jgi:RES domain-containing protein
MKLYRIADCKYINDLSGYGAAQSGGRWNSKRVFVIYTSQNISLAQLETLKRYETSRRHVTDKCLIILDVPGRSMLRIKATDLKQGWRNDPAPKYLQKAGDFFYNANKHLLLKVPSALNPEEYNYLINPRHINFSKIKILSAKPIAIDRRLIKIKGTKPGKGA